MKFTIPGKPVAKQSFRFTKSGRKYKDAKVTNYENLVRFYADSVFGHPLEGPIEVTLVAYWPSKKPDRKKHPRPAELKTTKPDADNISKAVLDGLNGIAFRDDAQIVRLAVEKWHAAQGDAPRVEVEIGSVA